MRDYKEMSPYLRKVCEQVKARSMHPELRRELGSHLQELVDEREGEGYGREEAVQWAMRQMGDPEAVGRSLNRIHKPRMNWGLLTGVLLLAGAGLAGMFSLSASSYGSYATARSNPFISQIGERHLEYVSVAVTLMLVLSLLDYRKLRSLSRPLYLFTLAGMLAVQWSGNMINGTARAVVLPFYFPIDIISWSPYLLIVAMAGIWTVSGVRLSGRSIQVNGWKAIALIGAPSLIYFKGHFLPELALFASVALIQYALLTGKWTRTILWAAGTGAAGFLAAWNTDYYSARISAALNPVLFADSEGYLQNMLREAIASAGWGGHGFGAANNQMLYPYTDMLFPYLIYSFGWAAGLFLAGLILWFLARTAQAWMSVHDLYGKALIAGVALLLAIQFVYAMAKLSGHVLIINLPMPFISYGVSHLAIEYAALGLLLSVYRRKDIIPGSTQPSRN